MGGDVRRSPRHLGAMAELAARLPAFARNRSHLISQMTTAFDDALVENWEPHEGTFHLPDPNDEHVAA
jgi:hypothetical protein